MGKSFAHQQWLKMYEEHSSRLFLFTKRQARNESEAEDILHDVFVKALDWLEAGREVSVGWLYNKARYVSLDYARSRDRRKERERAYATNECRLFEPNDRIRTDELMEIENAINELPNEQANVILLKIWGELTFDEIGSTLEISPNTAASRYRYGLEHLKKRLEVVK